jgi:Phage tail tube protein
MTISKGTSKQVGYKKETTWGVLAGNTSGKLIRRVTANFNLVKEAYESNEIRTDRQIADFRHGVRSAEGSLNGELSPASYADFMGSIVGRDFTTAPASSSASITIAASGTLYTVTRSTGDFLTDGFKVGQVVRLSGAGLDVANAAKNLLIASASATVLTVKVVNSSALVAEGPIASVTVTAVGKTTFVPTTGHTDQSYTVEEFYADIAQSEVYTGMKLNSMAVQLPATGLTTVDFGFAGKDLTQTGTSQYFTSPTAQNSNGIFAAVNGVMLVNGAPVALVTSADFSVERATENATAVGSNSVAEIFTGRIRVTGNLSVYFQDATFRGYFDSETPVSVVLTLTTDSTADSDFVTFTLPKVKLGSFTKDDGELGTVASASFQALLNDVIDTGLPATTIQIQDSAA